LRARALGWREFSKRLAPPLTARSGKQSPWGVDLSACLQVFWGKCLWSLGEARVAAALQVQNRLGASSRAPEPLPRVSARQL